MTGFGPRPELRWLPIDSLVVDDRYQREMDTRAGRSLVRRIADGFAWRRFSPLIVAGSGADEWLVIDGQHRAEAARLGGVDEVPCMIVDAADVADQADSFVSINRDRVTLHQYGLYKAQLAAGDPQALAVSRVCAAAGVDIPFYPVQARDMAPRTTLALGVVRRMIETSGEARTTDVLKFVADAYGDRAGNIRRPVLRAVALVFGGAHGQKIDRDWLARELAAKSASRWEAEAAEMREINGQTAEYNISRALLAACGVAAGLPQIAGPPEAASPRLSVEVMRRCETCTAPFRTRDPRQQRCDRHLVEAR